MSKILIIAEAGVNNNKRLDLAYEMVDAAKNAGADVVKFQTADPTALTSKYAPKASYQMETTDPNESQTDMLRNVMMEYEDFYPLKEYCNKAGIKFLSTPFDMKSIDFLEELGCDLYKIPSGEITNLPYLRRIGSLHKPVILSTGMSSMDEVSAALDILSSCKAGEITLLHCTTQYPAPYDSVNLSAMCAMKERFGLRVGYSDHTVGIEVPVAAVALGAEVIEKHFTLDKNMAGPDHKASLEPQELSAMVTAIRHIEEAMGDGIKRAAEAEKENIAIVRKSIVALRDIRKGEVLTEENITTKRPGNGISPMKWDEVIGSTAIRDFGADELIEL